MKKKKYLKTRWVFWVGCDQSVTERVKFHAAKSFPRKEEPGERSIYIEEEEALGIWTTGNVWQPPNTQVERCFRGTLFSPLSFSLVMWEMLCMLPDNFFPW